MSFREPSDAQVSSCMVDECRHASVVFGVDGMLVYDGLLEGSYFLFFLHVFIFGPKYGGPPHIFGVFVGGSRGQILWEISHSPFFWLMPRRVKSGPSNVFLIC